MEAAVTQYHQLRDGDWIRPRRRKFKEQCCDCGKVHDVDFRLVKSKKGNRYYIEFRAAANTRATARARSRYHDAAE